MTPPRVLLVSNGFGEMAIAGYLAREIRAAQPDAHIEHLPLVGTPPPDAGVKTVGPVADMPSGGLVAFWNLRNIARDLGAGLLGLTLRQFAFLSGRRDDVVIAVGDVFCLAACLIFGRRPTVFVATAKSEYVARHSNFEAAIARRARAVFARDIATAQALSGRGVRATFAGNVMMDGLTQDQIDLPCAEHAVRIGVLPGSRADAPGNAAAAARRLKKIAVLLGPRGRHVQAYVSLAPTVALEDLLAGLRRGGIDAAPTGAHHGVVALSADAAPGSSTEVAAAVVRDAFGDLLRASDIVLGQAGTGNEQAVGLGKPVVSAADSRPGKPDRVGWYRMRQQRLLGDALLVLPAADDDAFAAGVVSLLDDEQRREAMARAGRERMGGSGGAAIVAKAALAVAAKAEQP
ncbi:MAG TPA: lipid-A-disaccharide synthase-related protein [Candidatus Eremiobacteraceae bacterium]